MYNMEETKASSMLKGIIEMSYKAGFFDQIDAFDSLGDLLRDILTHIDGNKQPTPNPNMGMLGAQVSE